MTKQISLNVVVPCYNPPQGWENGLAGHFGSFCQRVSDWASPVKLILVNDGSLQHMADENLQRIRSLVPGLEIVSYQDNRGKGFALRKGVAAVQADLYLITDMDFPYTVDSMQKLAEQLRDRGGIAAGNRPADYYDKVPLMRRYLSKALRWVLRNGLRQPVDDSQCGLKGFDETGKALFLQTGIERFLFDLEFLMLANGKINITPVEVHLREGVTFSKVRLSVLVVELKNLIRLLVRV